LIVGKRMKKCARPERSPGQRVGFATASNNAGQADGKTQEWENCRSGAATRFRHQMSIVYRHYSCLNSMSLRFWGVMKSPG
jgi:hypothetical protein